MGAMRRGSERLHGSNPFGSILGYSATGPGRFSPDSSALESVELQSLRSAAERPQRVPSAKPRATPYGTNLSTALATNERLKLTP